MSKTNSIKLFEDKLVRSIWDDEKDEWYFSVADVVQVLTDSSNVTDYIKKMRKRDPELSEGWGQIVTPLAIQTSGGKQKINFASGNVAAVARKELESKTGRSVIGPLSAKKFFEGQIDDKNDKEEKQ